MAQDSATNQEIGLISKITQRFRSQAHNIGNTEVSMEALQLATKTRLDILYFMILAVVFMIVYFVIEIKIKYSDVINAVNAAELSPAVSGFAVAAAIKYPFTMQFTFKRNSQFPEAMFISLNMPQYNTAFSENAVVNTQTM